MRFLVVFVSLFLAVLNLSLLVSSALSLSLCMCALYLSICAHARVLHTCTVPYVPVRVLPLFAQKGGTETMEGHILPRTRTPPR